MQIEQIYTGCLAQGAYYIESDGEVAIIDPLRETEPYIEKARKDNAKIKYIFETHFHADFVSGHIDLAQKAGARIVYGPGAKTSYDKHTADDGEEFRVGSVTFRVLHTPGHTLESTTYLLLDESGKEHAIFTGDTLFIGDVGRPDLAQKKNHLTTADLAGMLYDSLRTKIMPLPDSVIVYPAHGAGSACGKSMSKKTWDTLGSQKATNYALREDMSREEFIAEVSEGLLPPPEYFAENVKRNMMGSENIDHVMERADQALSAADFERIANESGALVLDVRSKDQFALGHIPNSIFIGLDGSFAPWVGALIPDLMQPILLVAPIGREEETVKRLARVGYDNCLGYLEGSFDSWKKEDKEVDHIETIDAEMLAAKLQQATPLEILDVRRPAEWQAEHLSSSVNFPLDFINRNMGMVSPERSYHLHCKSGYRATVAASILKARGFTDIVNVVAPFEHFASVGLAMTSSADCSLDSA
ncbi:MAG: MBL fold metallo-hydrolase [Saprospiraceae bacterium]|nr:MBL fold metallo-hydrolase [Saprospiraceae bacterium]